MTCGSENEARKISEMAVRGRVTACVNIADVESAFEWHGKFENQTEKLLIMKTVNSRYAELEKLVRTHHTYENPEILAIEVAAVSKEYGNWVRESCKPE